MVTPPDPVQPDHAWSESQSDGSPAVTPGADDGISGELRAEALKRLGLPDTLPLDVAGLRQFYAAWCSAVPFDNVRKLIALRTNTAGALPGTRAVDFFEHWVEHGTGGTCWSSSNALFTLIRSFGFDARRVAGSMRDLGVPGHGSVKVTIDGSDWLVDSSMLTMHPIPLRDGVHVDRHPVFGVEVEAVDGSHLIWFDTPPYEEYFPCRLLLDRVEHVFYAERYELSRSRGPFNHHLSMRYNRSGLRFVLQAHTRYQQSAHGVVATELSRAELQRELCDNVGLSPAVVERFVECGALEAAFEPPAAPPTALVGRPPSRRGG
ncbi:MAG TPA: arylamine N-acetyltransferase [Gemmatimonas sp.]|nr:arylamine N-acetyltransferase [Gemmatimonas sp.]